jgi:hypothetical protein
MSRPITKKIKEEFIEDAYACVQQGFSVRGRSGCRCFREEIQGEKNSSSCGISIRRTAKGLEYNCFKASCELGGGIVGCGNTQDACAPGLRLDSTKQSSGSGGVLTNIALPQDCEPATSELGRRWLSQFTIGAVEVSRYGLSERRSDRFGLYFPVRGVDGRYCGYLRRSLESGIREGGEESTYPKWITHTEPSAIYLGRPLQRHRIVFIVEDAPSVIRIAKNGYNAVGLLGTSLRREQLPALMKYLVEVRAPRVVVALDPDATDKAKKIAGDLTNYWQGVKAITTTTDPKWWSDEQLEKEAQ